MARKIARRVADRIDSVISTDTMAHQERLARTAANTSTLMNSKLIGFL
jgi:hypothetical protein